MNMKSILMMPVNWKRKITFLLSQPNNYKINPRQRTRAFFLGFTPEEYAIFDLDHNSPKDYISEHERLCFRDKIKETRVLADNKIVCYNILRDFADVNKMYAYKLRKDANYTMLESADQDKDLMQILDDQKKLVYKRISFGGGGGFRLIEHANEDFYINRVKCSREDVEKLFSETDDYLIEDYCEQSDFENALFPYSVNTIRIVTVAHKDGTIEPIVALHRVGVDETKCVDNACAGGLYAQIDIDNGTLSAAYSRAVDSIGKSYINHPVTNAQIKGAVVPDWRNILDQVTMLHNKIRFTKLGFIAWDIALTNDGIKIIEANASCGMIFVQTFSGQRNGKIGDWLKEWGYIK